jgi:hypothetical protein
MKTKLLIFGCLAIVGAGVWYLLQKDKEIQEWIDEAPVGPIKDHLAIQEQAQEPAEVRELMHAAKEHI